MFRHSKLIATVLIATLGFAACNGGDEEVVISESDTDDWLTTTSMSTSTITTTTTTATDTTFSVDPGCTYFRPLSLTLHTDSLEEKPFLDKFVACTDHDFSGTTLTNNSALVWELRRTDGVALDPPGGIDDASTIFGIYMNEYLGGRMAQGAIAFQPHTKLVLTAPPHLLSWAPAALHTAAWQANDKAFKALAKYSLAKVAATAITSDRARRTAHFKCLSLGLGLAMQAHNAGQQVATQHLATGFAAATSAYQGFQCATAWQRLDDSRPVAATTVLDDVAKSFEQPALISTLDDGFKFAFKRGLYKLARRGRG